jgi:tyrosinase
LYEIMTQEIIPNQFDQSLRSELQSAADTWRLPYWDWAMQKPDWHDKANRSKFGPNVPEVITLQKVPVRGRTGGMVFVDNPMWKFTLPAGDHMGNHGIPFLEGEPVSELHARSFSFLLNGVVPNLPGYCQVATD